MGRGMTMDNRAYRFFACLFRSHRGERERKNLHTSLPGRSYIFPLLRHSLTLTRLPESDRWVQRLGDEGSLRCQREALKVVNEVSSW